jgi:LmbE family N-acetylglucosaminyl deacetylase
MKQLEKMITVPDAMPQSDGLSRTTHLAIGAHPDDVEIIGIEGISKCYQSETDWFTGIVVTNGAGSLRSGRYTSASDEEMIAVRQQEQSAAAEIGRYAAVVQMACESSQLQGDINESVVAMLQNVLEQARPHTVYLHSPVDRHITHIGVCMHALEALRRLNEKDLPVRIWGVEVWRSMDWVDAGQRVLLDVSGGKELQGRLLGQYQSQLVKGKRYDIALAGRNIANATLASEDAIDTIESACFALDLNSLVGKNPISIGEYLEDLLGRFSNDLKTKLSPYGSTD